MRLVLTTAGLLALLWMTSADQAQAQTISFTPSSNILCQPGNTLSIQNGYTIKGGGPVSDIYMACCPQGQNATFSCKNGFTVTSSGGSVLLTTTGVLSGAGPSGGTITGQTSTFALPATTPAAYTFKLAGFCYMGATDARGNRVYGQGPLGRSTVSFSHSLNVSVSVNNPSCN